MKTALSSTRKESPVPQQKAKFFSEPVLSPSENEGEENHIDVTTPGPLDEDPEKRRKSTKKKPKKGECPCRHSQGDKEWLLECTLCSQAWHASCGNLKGLNEVSDKRPVESILKHWVCPWCFKSPFVRPGSSKSSTLESSLLEKSSISVNSQKITDAIVEQLCKSIPDQINFAGIEAKIGDLKGHILELRNVNSGNSTGHKDEKRPAAAEKSTGHIKSNTKLPDLSPIESLENPTKHFEDYEEEFLSVDERVEVIEAIKNLKNYEKKRGRLVAVFGEEYPYPGAPRHSVKEIPAAITKIIEKIQDRDCFKGSTENINQVVVNKYTGKKSFLPEHSDNEPEIRPKSLIFGVTLGATRAIRFRDKFGKEGEKVLAPEDGSLYAMSMESQHYWSHRLDADEDEEENSGSTIRYSITFRSVGQECKNSLIILGDSNTKHLKFGSGKKNEQGTFGFLLPGERVETFHLRQIDPIKCLGYRNIMVHCAINDVRDRSPGRLQTDPHPTDVQAHVDILLLKLMTIKKYCPYASIIVSPILPTKSANLNKRCMRFNNILSDFVYNNKLGSGMKLLNFEDFVSYRGDMCVLRSDMGCWDTKTDTYHVKDKLHLGKRGVRLLAQIVRESVLGSTSNKQGKGSSGSYRNAFTGNSGSAVR